MKIAALAPIPRAKGQHGGPGKSGRFPELAEREANILQKYRRHDFPLRNKKRSRLPSNSELTQFLVFLALGVWTKPQTCPVMISQRPEADTVHRPGIIFRRPASIAAWNSDNLADLV